MVQILGLDVAGNPAQWLSAEQAITAAATGGIAWQWGDEAMVFHGGWNRDGEQSTIELRPIVSLVGRKPDAWLRDELPLTNTLLFRRDRYTCAYCGDQFSPRDLSCDHVIPRVQGGRDVWTNVVSACRPCNQRKGGRRPEQTRVCSCCSCPTRLAYGSTSFFRPEASWPIKWSFWQQDYLGIAELLISSPSELAKEDDVFQRGLV